MQYFGYTEKEPLIREIMVSKKREYLDEEPEFRIEPFTIVKHYSAIRSNENNRTVGIIEDEMMFLLGDRVEVRADSDGFIAPSILNEGVGVITRFRINGNVRFGVQMDNGEFGYVTGRHIWKKVSD